MASIATQLVDGIALSSSEMFAQWENRFSVYPIFADALNQQSIVSAGELASLRKTSGRPVRIPTLVKDNITLGGTRQCAITGVESATASTLVTWVTRTATMQISPVRNSDNYISYSAEFAGHLKSIRKKMFEQFETDLVASLVANKQQTNPDPLYNLANFRLEVPNADQNSLYDIIRTMMELNDYYGQYTVYSNTGARNLQEFISRQGTNNATNLSPQINMLNLFRSNRITTGVGVAEQHFVTPQGALAFVPWNFTSQLGAATSSFLDPRVIAKDTNEFFMQADDAFGINWDMHYIRNCSDTNLNGTRNSGNPTPVDLLEVSIDYAILTPFQSETPNQTSIFDVVLLS
jgi:hypothetical protein